MKINVHIFLGYLKRRNFYAIVKEIFVIVLRKTGMNFSQKNSLFSKILTIFIPITRYSLSTIRMNVLLCLSFHPFQQTIVWRNKTIL